MNAAKAAVPVQRNRGKNMPPHPNQAKRHSGIKATATTNVTSEGMVATAVKPAPGKRTPRAAARKAGDLDF
jgi:hypothetical protein